MARKLNIEEVLTSFKNIHDDLYDYSKAHYSNAKTKVEIICKKHGSFWQTPDKHRQGRKCPKCSGKGKNTSEIIQEFKSIYGNKYDYSKVEYKTSKQKLILICPEHGEFLKSAEKHRVGQGCPECAEINRREKRKTPFKELIADFKKMHGDRYDYSEVLYINTNTKVKIICPDHGLFEQNPSKHLIGHRCPKCVGKGLTQADLLKLFRKAHGKKYKYKFSSDLSAFAPISVICPIHGEFTQKIDNHKQGSGCRECGIEKVANAKRMSWKDVKKVFNQIHGNHYNYDKVEYIGMDYKVTLICPVHGEFQQKPSNHVNGSGCGKCLGRGLSRAEFVQRFRDVHGDRYLYTKVHETKKAKDKITIICKIHGEFQQEAFSHMSGCGCPFCTLTPQSKSELEINFELQQFFTEIDPKGFKTRLEGKLWSIDIYIPELNLGIEFDGSYWHKEKQQMDRMKTMRFKKEGYHILRIREEPLKKLFEKDIISKTPFKAKAVVNDVLRYILANYDVKKHKPQIEAYLKLKNTRNKEALNRYIDYLMDQKASN